MSEIGRLVAVTVDGLRAQVFFNGLGSAVVVLPTKTVVAAAFGFCLIAMRFASLQICRFTAASEPSVSR
jgi:type IV secretory pathway TrbD component